MDSKNNSQISINIPNYTGPLEVLLDLAKTQKVDLAEISITKLADQFLNFIKEQKDLNLETASEFLLMATWLAYLKSKLLLPEEDNDDFKASEVAEKLKLQLKKLELIRILSDQMLQKKRLGIHIHTRQMQKTFQNISIPKLPVFTAEEGIKMIRNNLDRLIDWKDIFELIPKFYKKSNMKRTGIAGIFAASLELSKEGIISVSQKKLFDRLRIKKL